MQALALFLVVALLVPLAGSAPMQLTRELFDSSKLPKCSVGSTSTCSLHPQFFSALPPPTDSIDRLLAHIMALKYACSLKPDAATCSSKSNPFCIFSREKKACMLKPSVVQLKSMFLLSCKGTQTRTAATCRLTRWCGKDSKDCTYRKEHGCIAKQLVMLDQKAVHNWHTLVLKGDQHPWGPTCSGAATFAKIFKSCRALRPEACSKDPSCMFWGSRAKGECITRVEAVEGVLRQDGKGAFAAAYRKELVNCEELDVAMCGSNEETFAPVAANFLDYVNVFKVAGEPIPHPLPVPRPFLPPGKVAKGSAPVPKVASKPSAAPQPKPSKPSPQKPQETGAGKAQSATQKQAQTPKNGSATGHVKWGSGEHHGFHPAAIAGVLLTLILVVPAVVFVVLRIRRAQSGYSPLSLGGFGQKGDSNSRLAVELNALRPPGATSSS